MKLNLGGEYSGVTPQSAFNRRLTGEEPEKSSTFHSVSLALLAMPVLAKLGLLITIAALFLRMGSVTFGGGLVMIPLIESEVVTTHHWLTHQEFADATALGYIPDCY